MGCTREVVSRATYAWMHRRQWLCVSAYRTGWLADARSGDGKCGQTVLVWPHFPPEVGAVSESVLERLPATFTYSAARREGLSDRALYALRSRGAIDQIARGLYRRADLAVDADLDLIEIAYRAPEATLCLASALARHGLTDLIPASIDVALPRPRRPPRAQAPVTWHRFDPATFDLGRDEFSMDGEMSIGIYNPARCIVDAFRLRHREGPELGREALRRWLSTPGAHPAELLAMAKHFPHAAPTVRDTLEVLL